MPASLCLSALEDLLRGMLRIRAFENAAEPIRSQSHRETSLVGHEAVPVGVCAHLRPGDHLTAAHQGHGRTLASLIGQDADSHEDRVDATHLVVGAAHAAKLQGKEGMSVCFFGDAAANVGQFMESLNWARVYALPVLFVCEDRPGVTVAAGEGALARAVAMGVPAEQVDGGDVLAVHAAAGRMVAQLRGGTGPFLLHARSRSCVAGVVDSSALERQGDPIARACARYLALGGTAQALQRMERAAQQEALRMQADAAPMRAMPVQSTAAPARPLWN